MQADHNDFYFKRYDGIGDHGRRIGFYIVHNISLAVVTITTFDDQENWFINALDDDYILTVMSFFPTSHLPSGLDFSSDFGCRVTFSAEDQAWLALRVE